MNAFVVIKNATANTFRIGASALTMLILPPILARSLPPEVYNTWALVVQISTYLLFLDFGIQTAVGRFVAYTLEQGDLQQRNRIISSAFALLLGSACLGIVLIVAIAWQLPFFFDGIPESTHKDARISLILLGGSFAISLPFSVFIGVFTGLQRNEISVGIIVAGKLLGTLLTAIVVIAKGDLILMAVAMAGANIFSYVVQYIAACRFVENVQISTRLISWSTLKEISSYCFGIMVWSVGMLLVSGLDPVIVGFFDFSKVANYTIAATLINFIIQLQSAIFSAFIPVSAAMSARDDSQALGELLISATRYGMFILLLTGIPFIIGARFILLLWVGSEYAETTTLLLQILTIANIIRLSGLPYATLLMGTNQQHLVVLSPLVEGVVNLVVSVIAAYFLGAIGVAIGTLFGAIISIGFHIFYNMPRTTRITCNRQRLILEGLSRPTICAIPGILVACFIMFWPELQYDFLLVFNLMIVTTAFVVVAFWQFGLISGERQRLMSLITRYGR